MSFYNMLFGRNANADVVLALLGLKETDIERFRDCHLLKDCISIYTRTGGGNRDDYPQDKLVNSPYYLRDEDDDGDYTYATFYFKFPDELKEDIIKFMDVKTNGVPAAIVNKCLEVWSRPETEDDKWKRIHDIQMKVCKDLRYYFKVYETNGHTIVPMTDDGMESLLRVAEANDLPGREGEFLPYSLVPFKLKVETNIKDWGGIAQVKVSLESPWTIDVPTWERYKEKFTAKYPKAIAAIAKRIDKKPEAEQNAFGI